MKMWVRLVLVFLAYGLALLHTAFPHHHVGFVRGEIVFSHAGCSQAHSAGGVLQRALATDLGLGHLETFNKASGTRIELSARGIATVALLPIVSVDIAVRPVHEFQNGFIRKLKSQLLLFSVNHFRAPPITL